jgi:nucleoside-diphosphate-sugar epimerase
MSLTVLFTGATGYIGGSVLAKLLADFRANKVDAHVRVLVRTKAKEEKLVAWAKSRGLETFVTPVLGSMDASLVSEVANAQVTIDTADADNLEAQKYVIEGLSKALKKGTHPIYIHTSGTGVLSDNARGLHESDKIFYDDNDDQINSIPDTNPHRNVDLLLTKFHQPNSSDLDLVIIAPPTIWGVGTGPDNVLSIQVPALVSAAIEQRQAYNVGTGENVWTHINILDLADLYVLILQNVLKEPNRHSGFYLAENGEFKWKEVVQAIQDGLVQAGYTSETTPSNTTSKEEYAKAFGTQSMDMISVVGGNSRARAIKGRRLGWNPRFSSKERFLRDCFEHVFIQSKFAK